MAEESCCTTGKFHKWYRHLFNGSCTWKSWKTEALTAQLCLKTPQVVAIKHILRYSNRCRNQSLSASSVTDNPTNNTYYLQLWRNANIFVSFLLREMDEGTKHDLVKIHSDLRAFCHKMWQMIYKRVFIYLRIYL